MRSILSYLLANEPKFINNVHTLIFSMHFHYNYVTLLLILLITYDIFTGVYIAVYH